MLTLIDNSKIATWFELYQITPKGLVKTAGKYPLDYEDSRFHNVLKRLSSGNYRAYKAGSDPSSTKPIVIDYPSAEKYFRPGIVEELPKLEVDWNELFQKWDKPKKSKKFERKQLELKQEIQAFSEYVSQESVQTKALMIAVERYKKGLVVPSHLLVKVKEYLQSEHRRQRGWS